MPHHPLAQPPAQVEPWNSSVRVALSIPPAAAARLRQLAADGNGALRALGILAVQLDGESSISLRVPAAGSGGAYQDIVLRTTPAATIGKCRRRQRRRRRAVLASNVYK